MSGRPCVMSGYRLPGLDETGSEGNAEGRPSPPCLIEAVIGSNVDRVTEVRATGPAHGELAAPSTQEPGNSRSPHTLYDIDLGETGASLSS